MFRGELSVSFLQQGAGNCRRSAGALHQRTQMEFLYLQSKPGLVSGMEWWRWLCSTALNETSSRSGQGTM